MHSTNRFTSRLGIIAADTIATQIVGGVHDPWQRLTVIAAASDACRRNGLVEPGVDGLRVAAAVNTYVHLFLPVGELVDRDEEVLVWDTADGLLHDVLWVERWQQPLPSSAVLGSIGDHVRLVDLQRPGATREYVGGTSRTAVAS